MRTNLNELKNFLELEHYTVILVLNIFILSTFKS